MLIFCHICPRIATEVQNNDILFVVFYMNTIEHFSCYRVDKYFLHDMELGRNAVHMIIFSYKVYHKTNLCQNIFWLQGQFAHKNI